MFQLSRDQEVNSFTCASSFRFLLEKIPRIFSVLNRYSGLNIFYRMSDRAAAERTLHDQTNILPRAQLIVVFSTLAVTLLICFVDQNGISVALPTIAQDLNAQATVSWAGTSSLIANTVFQMVYGRLVSRTAGET